MYVNVLVEIGAKSVDREFVYFVPESLQNQIQIGIRVKVSFGKQTIEGFVISIFNDYHDDMSLKPIIEVIDPEPILNKEMIYLGKQIKETTLCSLISAYQAMLPKALKASINTNINIKEDKYLVINQDNQTINAYLEHCRYPKQKELLEEIIKRQELKITRIDSTIKTLIKHGLIKIITKEAYRFQAKEDNHYHEVKLNKDQQNVVDTVKANITNPITYLLYGVTGSGKTEVYMEIINYVLSLNKTAIMLVPEISLTPQIVGRFVNRFHDNIAILHSGLSDSERYDEYRKIKRGEVKIVIGARSAIFAPLDNLGIIIIDEEHTSTYKQDNHPRYNAKDVAILRSKYHRCPVLLGSATPSLESFAKAGNHVYQLLTLPKRANNKPLPHVNIIDMKQEVKTGNFILSKQLQEQIQKRLDNKEQVILLLNRRGYSSMITCRNCGHVIKCPNCDISLTYHKTSDNLRCHYCGYNQKRPNICPECGHEEAKDFGLGTERLEEEINQKFNARVIRMDLDTTSKKGAHEKIIEDFGNHKYDILLGTQMIAKGLDFPLVTLVGVINADTTLNVPDFRSSERTFQLLCQVSGRAGRSDNPGEVIIQTYNPDHYSIKYAQKHDYLGFYKEEMSIRKKLGYSPYYYITLVKIYSKDYKLGFEHANKIGDYLRKNVDETTIILGPTMAPIFKINNIYNYQCIIKYRKDPKLKQTLINLDNIYKTENKINVEIDVDPTRL